MKETTLDMDSLKVLLFNVLKQMDEKTMRDMGLLMDVKTLEEVLLEVLGITKHCLSPEEEEELFSLLKKVLKSARHKNSSNNNE